MAGARFGTAEAVPYHGPAAVDDFSRHQNSLTGRLTPAMFKRVLREVRDYLRG